LIIRAEIPTDEEGYADRQCPAEKCRQRFKILAEDWQNKVKEEAAFCPFCRHEDPRNDWLTEAQWEHLNKKVEVWMVNEFSRVVVSGFNRTAPRGGLLRLSMKPARPPRVMPIRVTKLMEQRYTCEACGCRYCTTGSAVFCPACGHNSVITGFSDTIAHVRDMLGKLPGIREAAGSPDAAADLSRFILENSIKTLVTSIERLAEELYILVPGAPAPKKGVFQRLDEASNLWRTASKKGYDEILGPRDYRELKILFQKRHLLTHREGIVDADYLAKSGDIEFSAGQRVTITPADVRKLAGYAERLASELR
jgi:hypothetical protein